MRHWARYQTEVKRLYEVLEKRLAEVKAPLASPNQLNTAQVLPFGPAQSVERGRHGRTGQSSKPQLVA